MALEISHKISSVNVDLTLPETQDSLIFILGETMPYVVTSGEGYVGEPDDILYDTECQEYMWEGIDKLDIEDVEYNGHFGYFVGFRTTPELVDKNVELMIELINLYVKTYKEADTNNDTIRDMMAIDAVHKQIKKEIEDYEFHGTPAR